MTNPNSGRKVLQQNLEKILEKMKVHFQRRTEEAKALPTPRLIAVSKFQPQEKIVALSQLGQKCFGENYVQEFSEKRETLLDRGLEWHFIGHLQSNKVKDVAGKCEMIHSLDSIKIIEKIHAFCLEKNLPPQKVLLQIRSGQEETKSGLSIEDVRTFPQRIWELSHLKICGFMTLPPLQNEPEDNRVHFKNLRIFFQEINEKLPSERKLTELSMGTSHDYMVAIEEGATFIRVGTELFGERIQKKETETHG